MYIKGGFAFSSCTVADRHCLPGPGALHGHEVDQAVLGLLVGGREELENLLVHGGPLCKAVRCVRGTTAALLEQHGRQQAELRALVRVRVGDDLGDLLNENNDDERGGGTVTLGPGAAEAKKGSGLK